MKLMTITKQAFTDWSRDLAKHSLGCVLLALVGCVGSPLISPAFVRNATAIGAQAGEAYYPAAIPGVKIARDVICAEASQTNINANKIVADLGAAGITNSEAMFIAQGGITLFQQVAATLGTNNAAKLLPYLQAVCDGLNTANPANVQTAKKAALIRKP